MSDDAALMKEIARLSGSISNHKRQQAVSSGRGGPRGGYRGYRGGARGGSYGGHGVSRGRGGYYGSPYHTPYPSRGTRGARARGGRGGNMSYTAPAVKFQAPCSNFTSTGNVGNCKRWTNSGKCVHGLSCRYQHDPNHIALCKTVLHGKDCRDPMCTLSHDMNEHNAPLCTHFAKGHCTRGDCRFTHMANLSNPPAGICPAFSVSGYCDNGSTCSKLHVFECPEFAESGKCTRIKCNLQHTLRANTHPSEPSESAAPAPIQPQKIDVSLLLEDIASEGEDEGEDQGEDEDEDEAAQEPSESGSDSDEALDPGDFDDIKVDVPDDEDGESFIHV